MELTDWNLLPSTKQQNSVFTNFTTRFVIGPRFIIHYDWSKYAVSCHIFALLVNRKLFRHWKWCSLRLGLICIGSHASWRLDLAGCLLVKEMLHVKTNKEVNSDATRAVPSSVLDGKFRSNCASAQQLESKIFSWSLHDHSFENRRWDSLFGFTLEILMCQARGILEIQTCVKCFMIWFKFYRPFSRVSSHFPCEVLYCSRWHSKFWLLQTTNNGDVICKGGGFMLQLEIMFLSPKYEVKW